MKKCFTYLILGIATFAFPGCNKDDNETPYTCKSCVTNPEALAANDNISKGVYKGVVVGSSGTIKISIANGSETMTCTITVDGKTAELTTDDTYVEEADLQITFTGTFNGGEATIGFNVGSDGSDPYITYADIPGHANVTVVVAKELSTALIEAFEGEYSGSSSGTFNLIVSRDLGLWGAVTHNDDIFEGTLTNGNLTGTNYDETIDVTGKLGDDTVSGDWNADNGDKGKWEGKRTM